MNCLHGTILTNTESNSVKNAFSSYMLSVHSSRMLLTMVATCNVKITDILEKTENKMGFLMSWGTLVDFTKHRYVSKGFSY